VFIILQSSIVPITLREILSACNIFNSKAAEFEKLFSEFVDCKHVVLTSSGTSALYVLLKAYGLGRGDGVAVPAYVCEKVVRLIIDMGYSVKFVDVEKDTYNLSVEDLNNKIDRNTKAVIAVHMFGNPCKMKEILEISHDRNAVVIEDSAQCICAEYHGRKVGSLGDSAFFSFGEGKPITTIVGGAITTNDEMLANTARSIVNKFGKNNVYKILSKLILYYLVGNRWLYGIVYGRVRSRRMERWKELRKPMNLKTLEKKFEEIQASIGIVQLRKLKSFNEARYNNSMFLIEQLKEFESIRTPKILPNCKPIFLRLPMYVENEDLKRWLLEYLIRSRIDASPTYPNYLPDFFQIDGECPNARDLVRGTITLPVHPYVNRRDILKIVDIVGRFVR